MAEQRLQRALSRCGVASRREAERFIRAGRVRVNGQVAVIGQRVDPRRDRIEVDGQPAPGEEEKVCALLNKPRGVLTTLKDPEGRSTVVALIAPLGVRVVPVGRLDRASEGLLLLTNDGDLMYRLLHPRYRIQRVYDVTVDAAVAGARLAQLRAGVQWEGRLCVPDRLEVQHLEPGRSWIRVTVHEGRNHEVRRLMEGVGLNVLRLRRIRFGPVELGDLPAGAVRRLRPAEIRALHRSVGM